MRGARSSDPLQLPRRAGAMETYTIELRRPGPGAPWGFRLQGGADFATPLSVQVVQQESIAALAGLCAGDGVLKINGKNADLMEHEQAKEEIIRAGNLVVFTVQRGAVMTWKPKVTPLSELRPTSGPSHISSVTADAPTQKTSLASLRPDPVHIGSSHNRAPKPFGVTLTDDKPTTIVHAQYNSPLSLYSARNVSETFSQQAEAARSNLGIVSRDAPDHPTTQRRPSATAAAAASQAHAAAILPSKGAAPAAAKAGRVGDTDATVAAAGAPVPASVQPQKEAVLSALRKDGQFQRKGSQLGPDANAADTATSAASAAEPSLYKGGSIKSRTFRMLEQEMDNGTVGKNGSVTSPTGSEGLATAAPPAPDSSSKWCYVCGGFITGVFVKVKGHVLHGDCLRCHRCKISLKNIGYFWVNDNIYCEQHARDITRPPGGGYTAYVIDAPNETQ